MKAFHESDRHAYNFTRDSWVLECGAHEGQTADILASKYGCRIVCYEPVKEFYLKLASRFICTPLANLIYPVHAGLGARARTEEFGVKGDLSGIVCDGNYRESVKIVSVTDALANWTKEFGRTPDLLAINAEGMEMEILESILDAGMERFCAHIQCQPHSVIPKAAERWAGIRNRLLMNFRITSEDPQMDRGWLLLERK